VPVDEAGGVGSGYTQDMASRAFRELSPVHQYMVNLLAIRERVPVDVVVAQLSLAEIEQRVPGARAAYERRHETAERLRQRLGIDPTSPANQAAVREIRELLDQVDQAE
jgi:hypothetical protein